ncbi:oxidoreductase [Chryseobacterium piperi]|uniref:Oxidoreductase n=1 Tax=Chryseobacterium piperi TaxID=558152 RepID=A0A086BK53_9FLAO|nr:NADP-dependent oxidoreductase [Chryseobacterium piperi]ATL76016.1 oxidoreductase [Chryseobacterium piperi]KFF29317.1 oxidoreductase [Chryseobacterium piperi]
MKAIVIEQPGGVEQLIHTEVPKPTPGKGEVLVKVKAISVNPIDTIVRADENEFAWAFGEKRPVIPGWDISGDVVEKGPEAESFNVGDAVLGLVNFPGIGNAYAEYVAVPVSQLALKPDHVSYEEAAAATLAATTAWQAIVTNGKVKKGDKVLIHAASGGVGHYAVQIAKSFGAYVIGTTSGANIDFITSIGVDEPIDYTQKDFSQEVSSVDIVLDPFGGTVLEKSVGIMKPGGRIISLLSPEVNEAATKIVEEKNIEIIPMVVESNGDDMKSIAGLLDKGALKSHVDFVYPFSEMDKAHLQIEKRRTVGKIVVNNL